jgi:hypothetical protein
MAEYMLVPCARLFVPLGDLSPAKAAKRVDHAETTEFPLTQAVDVYASLKAREITGRAVLISA